MCVAHIDCSAYFLGGPTVICNDAKCARQTLQTTSVVLRFTHTCLCTTKICPCVRRCCFSHPWQFLRVFFFRMNLCVMQRHTTRGREKPPTCQRRENTQNLQTCWTPQHNVCPEAPSSPPLPIPPSPTEYGLGLCPLLQKIVSSQATKYVSERAMRHHKSLHKSSKYISSKELELQVHGRHVL